MRWLCVLILFFVSVLSQVSALIAGQGESLASSTDLQCTQPASRPPAIFAPSTKADHAICLALTPLSPISRTSSPITLVQLRCPPGMGRCPSGICCHMGTVCCGTRCCINGALCYEGQFCAPRGINYCGGGKWCQPGQRCCPAFGKCCFPGSICTSQGCQQIGDACGNNRYCLQGLKCRSGGGCMPIGSVDCGGPLGVCRPGSKCSVGGGCVPENSVDCGGGRSCRVGLQCAPNGCWPVGAVGCGNGYCNAGQICTSTGGISGCIDPTRKDPSPSQTPLPPLAPPPPRPADVPLPDLPSQD